MGTCPRCKHDHPPVSFTAWAWAVRDAVREMKPKPPAGQVAVLFVLGSRTDPATGCGWVTRESLMGNLDVSRDTVTRATIRALESGLLRRLRRGGRAGDGSVTYSRWALADPADPPPGEVSTAQTGTVEKEVSTAQTGTVEKVSRAQTGVLKGANETPKCKTRSVRPSLKGTPPTGVSRARGPAGSSRAQTTAIENPPATASGGRPETRKHGTRVPPDLPDQLRADASFCAWFRRECPAVDGHYEMAQFMDYWAAKTGKDATKLDWKRTVQKWMRKAQQDARHSARRRESGFMQAARVIAEDAAARPGYTPPLEITEGDTPP